MTYWSYYLLTAYSVGTATKRTSVSILREHFRSIDHIKVIVFNGIF